MTEVSNVVSLWNRLSAMEDERRFSGNEYPDGTAKFPFRLRGQGFFAGGDGLWREADALEQPSDGELPAHGIVFLGNDFGTLKTFLQKRSKGFENPLTWRHIKARVTAAGLPTDLTFFTNAFMGLREEGTALDPKDWSLMPKFCEFCAEFLEFQLQQLRPRLLVLMGPKPQQAFNSLVGSSSIARSYKVLKTSHPHGDFGFSPERRAQDVQQLKDAWLSAS